MRRLMLVGLLLAAAPGQTAPLLTVRLENLSAPEVALRLEAFYGQPIILAPAPEKGAIGPKAELRATFNWRNASLGQVVADVERAFRLQAIRLGSGAIRFAPAASNNSGITVDGEAVSITLREVRQTETRHKLVGAGTTEVESTLRLTLGLRPKEGDPDVIRGVTGLTATADRSGLKPSAGELVTPLSAGEFPSRPDERVVQVEVRAPPAGTNRAVMVEGQVLLHRSTRNYRMELSGPEYVSNLSRASRVQITLLPQERASVNSVVFKISWQEAIRVQVGSGSEPSGIRCFLRSASGAIAPVALSGIQSYSEPNGAGVAQVTAALPPESAGTGTLVWDITAFDPQESWVPFRFPRVLLPLAVPQAQSAKRAKKMNRFSDDAP